MMSARIDAPSPAAIASAAVVSALHVLLLCLAGLVLHGVGRIEAHPLPGVPGLPFPSVPESFH
jgi:hypothetical protein